MNIQNVRVYGLEESIMASAYPMQTTTENWDVGIKIVEPKDVKRAIHLGHAKSGSGHDCYLKGIVVQYDLTAPEYFWRQFDRYHFHDYISSMSKMHCILKFDISKICNKYVNKKVIEVVEDYINAYNNYDEYVDKCTKFNTPISEIETKQELFQYILSNTPMGLELTARITDNYLQLKSKHSQRENHKLEEWHYYCDWMKTLPKFKELVLKEE